MPAPKDRSQISIRAERAVLAAVHLPQSRFDPRDPLGELRALAETAGVAPVAELVQKRDIPESATYMGSGKVEELGRMADELDAAVIIFDHELSPKQIANIEQITKRKVIDRSELILDIFASRATTRQSQLAVELAQLEYTYPRLRAMWDHLERIVGGAGGMKGVGTRGPGEQQIEIDRRLVNRRKAILRSELADINERKHREVRDRRLDHCTVGIVGYTNAGKSTLFNTLTAGGAHANDQLFATLMTRTREWDLGGGQRVMLSDTVGFVRDLPHHLIASFRATLEEATHADCLLIVLDVSDPAAELQLQTVEETLDELFAEVRRREGHGDEWKEPARILLLNKADKLTDNTELLVWQRRRPDAIPFCAAESNGLGHAQLTRRVADLSRGEIRERVLTLPLSDSKAVHFIETRCEVLDREYVDSSVRLRARIGDRQLAQLRAAGARLTIDPDAAASANERSMR